MALPIPPRRCASVQNLSKVTAKAMFEGTRTGDWLNKLTDDQWEIVSFESQTRLVCIEVYVNRGINHMNLTLPVLSVSSLT